MVLCDSLVGHGLHSSDADLVSVPLLAGVGLLGVNPRPRRTPESRTPESRTPESRPVLAPPQPPQAKATPASPRRLPPAADRALTCHLRARVPARSLDTRPAADAAAFRPGRASERGARSFRVASMWGPPATPRFPGALRTVPFEGSVPVGVSVADTGSVPSDFLAPLWSAFPSADAVKTTETGSGHH